MIKAQELERQRIGRELHDQAGQALLALRAELQILAGQVPAEAAQAHAQIGKIDGILRDTRDLRLLSHELHSQLLDEFGLASALQQQVRERASLLTISLPTVRTHQANLKTKLGLKNLADLLRHALDHHIVASNVQPFNSREEV